MHRHPAGEDGAVAGELAVALPAVVLVLLLGISSLGAAASAVRLQDASADAARLLARGESESEAAAVVVRAVDGAQMSSSRPDDLVCVTARAEANVGRLVSIPLSARSCALAGGR